MIGAGSFYMASKHSSQPGSIAEIPYRKQCYEQMARKWLLQNCRSGNIDI